MNLIDKLRQNFSDVDTSVSQLLSLHFKCNKTMEGHVSNLRAKRSEIEKTVASLRSIVGKTNENGSHFTSNLATHGEQQAKETRLCREHHRQETEAFGEQSDKVGKALERLTKLAVGLKAKTDGHQQQVVQGFASVSRQTDQSGDQIRALGTKGVDQSHRQEEESSKVAGETTEKGANAVTAVTKLEQGATTQAQHSQKSLQLLGQSGKADIGESLKSSSSKWKSSVQKDVADFRKDLTTKKTALLTNLEKASQKTEKWLDSVPGEFEETVVTEVAKDIKDGRNNVADISTKSEAVANVCLKLDPQLPVLEALHQEILRTTGKGPK